jgi:[histone H3]-lysine79 N-trimethyltransferase
LPKNPSNQDYDPIDELKRTVRLALSYFIPDGSEMVDDLTGVVWLLERALKQGNETVVKEQLKRYNKLVDTSRDEGHIAKELSKKHSVTEDLVDRIMDQVYSRTALWQVEKLKDTKAHSSNTYGELLPKFVRQLFQETGLTSEQVFVDLGSGIGNVVLQAALEFGCESWGCEEMETYSDVAKQQEEEFAARCQLWGIKSGAVQIEKGDFLKSDVILEAIRQADVILCNNFKFDSKLNNSLAHLFLDVKEGCQIISLRSFYDEHINGSNEESISTSFRVEKKRCFSGCVSWAHEGVEYFISTRDKTRMEKYRKQQARRARTFSE